MNIIVLSKYNIIFTAIEKTGRKPCGIKEQIMGIVMPLKCDFNNVTSTMRPAYGVVMCLHCKGFLEM